MGWPGHKQKRRTLSKPSIYLQGETFSTLKAEIDLLLLKYFHHCNICCGSNLIVGFNQTGLKFSNWIEIFQHITRSHLFYLSL